MKPGQPLDETPGGGLSAYSSPPDSPTTARRHRHTSAVQAGGGNKRRGGGGAPAAAVALSPAATNATTAAAAAARHATLDACVKIFAVHAEPSFSLPWSIKRQYPSSSSAFVIPGCRILTNAHCVEYAVQVKVKRRDSPDRFLADIVAVSTEADLALLSVSDDRFWEDGGGIPSVTFADEVPHLQDRVMVAGFSVGGTGLSITAGVVSRVEVQGYAHSGAELLAVQSDAPISSGNSGGPAFQGDGRCIGAAFQSLRGDEAEGIGYVIPTPIVRRFLEDVERNAGKYTGFAALGVEWQKIESASLRRALGLAAGTSDGVLVRRVEPTAPAAKVLRRGDVLLAFDGTPVSSDGSVHFRQGERVSFSFLISQKFVGEDVELRVLRAPPGALNSNDHKDDKDDDDDDDEEEEAEEERNGASRGGSRGALAAAALPWPSRQPETVRVNLQRPVRLVPYHLDPGRRPSYFVFGGLVFTPLSAGYLRSEYGRDWEAEGPISLISKLTSGVARQRDEQVILLAQVLAHRVNVGFEEIVAAPVRSVNGARVRSMRALVRETELVVKRGDAFLRVELANKTEVVLDAKEAAAATAEILAAHAIAQDRSADLLPGEAEEEEDLVGQAAAKKKQKKTSNKPPAAAAGKKKTNGKKRGR
jgi:S1-C subfamily serine protease